MILLLGLVLHPISLILEILSVTAIHFNKFTHSVLNVPVLNALCLALLSCVSKGEEQSNNLKQTTRILTYALMLPVTG